MQRRLWIFMSFVCLAAGLSLPFDVIPVSYAQADGTVTHSVNGATESWRIDQPNVKQHVTEYRQIRFQPGDRITINAGGCVQTGGHGDTWKRYVDPSGPNADHLYHGLIWIPGVIGGRAATGVPPDPKRIVAYLGPNQAVTVPSGVDSAQMFLRLGYEDDGYGDNGYYAHDDGTQNQCKNVGNAYVSLSIVHGTPTPDGTAPAPFDLVWTSEDDNGIPLNAKWGWQVTHPGAFPAPTQCSNGPFQSPCTNWFDVITSDTAEVCNLEQYEPFKDNSPPLYGVAGHENWAAGTYVGRITWESHSTPGTDDDYNFDLFPEGSAGLVSVRNNIEVEYDSDETIDHFNSPWWNAFHSAVDNKSDDEVNQLFFKEPDGSIGRYGIVTGLEGLEMCHSGSNELHPAWAFAVRVKDDDPNDEVWAMFVRRTGDEGFCSGNQHQLTDLPGDTYTFRLPWRPGASSVESTASTVFFQTSGGGSGPGVQWAPSQGVLVSFKAPMGGNIIYGELHLRWPGGQGPAPIPSTNSAPGGRMGTTIIGGARELRGGSIAARGPIAGALLEGPEERIAAAMAKMADTQRRALMAASPRGAVSYRTIPLAAGAVTRIQALPQHPARPRRKQFQSVADPVKQQKNQRLLEALRAVR